MEDKEYILAIGEMDVWQVLQEVLNHPEYLTDGYYSDFGAALSKRGWELIEQKEVET